MTAPTNRLVPSIAFVQVLRSVPSNTVAPVAAVPATLVNAEPRLAVACSSSWPCMPSGDRPPVYVRLSTITTLLPETLHDSIASAKVFDVVGSSPIRYLP